MQLGERMAQPIFHRAGGDAERVGRLLQREFLIVMQVNRVAHVGFQRVHALVKFGRQI